jgi:transposase-like protein
MSQSRNTLQEKLRKKLEAVKSEEPETDWLCDLVEWLYQEMLEMEFTDHLGAGPYERTAGRQGYRNGYRERQLHTRVGTVTLRVPRDREGKFSTRLFERCQRSERAMILALQEAYVNGVSTRKVSRVTEKLCGTEFSKDQVSRMAQALDEELDRWRGRRFDKRYPYLVIDARYEHVRDDGRVMSEGVLTVEGINEQGHREVIAVAMAPGEDKSSWGELFRGLIERGLNPSEVVCVTSDDHLGLREALQRYFPHAIWQRCQAHYQQNAASKVLRRDRAEVHDQLRDVFAAPDHEEAQRRAEQMIEQWSRRVPAFAEWLEETIEQPLTVFQLPKGHRVRLRTTNNLEKYHQEIKRRTRVVRIFPNRRSCLRLVSALAMEQSEEWLTSPRYLTMMQTEAVEEPLNEDVLQPVT